MTTTKEPGGKAAPKKPTKKKAPTKGETIEEMVELLGKIEKAEKAAQMAEIMLDSKKQEAKTAKGVLMTRVAELRTLVRTRERWAEEAKRQPLFGDAAKKAEEAKATPTPGGDQVTAIDWRNTRIDKSGLFTEKQAEALETAGLLTLGGLQDVMRAEPEWWAKNKGVNGRFKVDVEDRLNAFIAQQVQAEPAKAA